MNDRIFKLNLQAGHSNLTCVGLSQYDAGVPMKFYIYDGATAASFPSGTTAKIQGVRPSGVGFNESCTLTDNVVTVDSSTDMTGEAGKFPVEIRFEYSGVDVGTVNFVMSIEKAPHPDGTIDADITHEQEFIDRLEAIEEWIATADQGVSDELKAALLQIAQKVVYVDEHGQDYYNDLYDALYPPAPPATLVSISAVYTQGGTVYASTPLDDLKTDLVVTALWDDSTTTTVTDYTLSGTLAVGTSTVTVSYSGKTTTFTVIVSEYVPQSYSLSEPTQTGDQNALTTAYLIDGELDLSGIGAGSNRYYQQKLSPACVVTIASNTSGYSLGFFYAVINGEMYAYNGSWHNLSQGEASGSALDVRNQTGTTPGIASEVVVLSRSRDLTLCTINEVVEG